SGLERAGQAHLVVVLEADAESVDRTYAAHRIGQVGRVGAGQREAAPRATDRDVGHHLDLHSRRVIHRHRSPTGWAGARFARIAVRSDRREVPGEVAQPYACIRHTRLTVRAHRAQPVLIPAHRIVIEGPEWN